MIKKIIKKTAKILGFRIEKIRDKEFTFKNNFPELLSLNNREVLIAAQDYIKIFKNNFKDFKIVNKENGFVLEFLGLKMYVETTEEFFIINEVFIEQDYNFTTPNKSVLIDIGANIGTSSLYFSTLDCVDKIYAFEPVLDTFKQAELNFYLNKSKNKVVEFNNFGLGKNNRNEIFAFDNSFKGNTGVRGELSSSYSNNSNTTEVKVKIKEATNVLRKVVSENPNTTIIVKMDCEGAEYEIFENILESGFIKEVDVFMLEWHDKGSKYIEDALALNGFNYFSKILAPNAGMIYASKCQKI